MDLIRLKELSGIELTEATDKLSAKVASMPLADAKNYAWKVIKKNGDLSIDQKLQYAGDIIKAVDNAGVNRALKVIANIQSGNYKANVEAARK